AAGEWSDRGDMASCRRIQVEWPDRLPGPALPAPPGVSVAAIVKPALGLTPEEAAAVAAELAAGGAVLVKDDELQRSSPERVRAIDPAIPEHVLYAANVTGADADAIVEAGARALMVNAFPARLGRVRASGRRAGGCCRDGRGDRGLGREEREIGLALAAQHRKVDRDAADVARFRQCDRLRLQPIGSESPAAAGLRRIAADE